MVESVGLDFQLIEHENRKISLKQLYFLNFKSQLLIKNILRACITRIYEAKESENYRSIYLLSYRAQQKHHSKQSKKIIQTKIVTTRTPTKV